jgi:hypothetical protein
LTAPGRQGWLPYVRSDSSELDGARSWNRRAPIGTATAFSFTPKNLLTLTITTATWLLLSVSTSVIADTFAARSQNTLADQVRRPRPDSLAWLDEAGGESRAVVGVPAQLSGPCAVSRRSAQCFSVVNQRNTSNYMQGRIRSVNDPRSRRNLAAKEVEVAMSLLLCALHSRLFGASDLLRLCYRVLRKCASTGY